MFVYKKLFSFPTPFHNAEGGTGGGEGGQSSSTGGTPPNGGKEGQQGAEGGQETDIGQGTGTDKEEKTVPYQRFSELNKKQKELQTQLDTLLQEKTKAEKEKEKADREAKEKQGEFENLYTDTKGKYEQMESEYTATKSRVDALESVVQELLDNELQTIDKEHLELIPDNLSVEQKLSWVAKAKAKGLFGGKKEDTPIGGPANPSTPTRKVSEMTPNELFKMAFSQKK